MRVLNSLALCTLVVNWTLTLLAIVLVFTVYYRRFRSVRPDDILLLVSLLVAVVIVSLSTWAILDEGQAEHQQNIAESHLERAAKSLLVAEALWTLVTGLLRITACLAVDSVCKHAKWAYCINITVMALSAGLAAASVIQIFLICRPFAAQWDPRVLGSCGDQIVSFMALEVAGLILDLALLVVPTYLIRAVQIVPRRKVALILLFNIGAVVLVVTGLRMASLRKAVSPDFIYSQSYLSLLSASGCMAGIICCATPALLPLMDDFRRVVASLTVRGRGEWRYVDVVKEGSGSRGEERRPCELPPSGMVRCSWHPPTSGQSAREHSWLHNPATDIEAPGHPDGGELGKGAVVIADFVRAAEDQLDLQQGQLVYIYERRSPDWLLAENLMTEDVGLIPERCVQLLLVGGNISGMDTKAELKSWWESHTWPRNKPDLQEDSGSLEVVPT